MPGIQYPAGIKDIVKFDHQKNISVNVNVYGYKDKKNLSLYVLPP